MQNKIDNISDLAGMELILECLRARRSRRIFKRWFSGLKLYEKKSSLLILTAPTDALAEEISILFGTSDLLQAVQAVWPKINCIRIKPAPRIAPKKDSSSAQSSLELAA